MTSSEIGNRLGIIANSSNGFTPQEKGAALAEIVIYIRQLEDFKKQINLEDR